MSICCQTTPYTTKLSDYSCSTDCKCDEKKELLNPTSETEQPLCTEVLRDDAWDRPRDDTIIRGMD